MEQLFSGNQRKMAFEGAVAEAIIKTIADIGIKIYEEIPDFKFDEKIKQLFFNASNKYAKFYGDRHGQVQVLGMSKPVPLDAIYSGVWVLDIEDLKSYDSCETLEEAYRARGDRRFTNNNYIKHDGIKIANEFDRLIVLGDPGIGKTTFLRKVGLEVLKGEQGIYRHTKIPVFLELKRLNSPDLDLEAFIAAEFESCGFPSAEGFTKKALKKGYLLILFDGLDEVPSDNLDIVIQKIQDLVDQYSDNRFIASCRIAAYHTYFKRVNTVAILEFDDDQIKKFIINWFSSELDQQNQTAQQCWDLLQKPENKGSKELAQSPLLLTFLCMVYNKSMTFPSNRTTLYEDALNIYLKEWASEKRVGRGQIYEGFHIDLEKQLLAKISYDGFENNQLFFSKEQLIEPIIDFLSDSLGAPKHLDASSILEAIEVQQGIFVERAIDVYSFSHLTLQEFLTARYIFNRWDLLDDVVQRYAIDDRWREVFLLIAGLMGGVAISFLEILEFQTLKLSEHSKLKSLLTWVETKTTNTSSVHTGEVRRLFALLLNRALNRTLNQDPYHANTRAFNRARTHALNRARTRARGRERDLDFELDLDLGLANDFVPDLDLDLNRVLVRAYARERAPDLNLTPDLTLARDLAKAALNKQLVVDVDLPPLISYLENASGSYQNLDKDFISVICASLDISPACFQLSSDEALVITNYLSICQLMLDCSRQASGLSARCWEAIKQRMFLPKS